MGVHVCACVGLCESDVLGWCIFVALCVQLCVCVCRIDLLGWCKLSGY